MMQGMQKTHGFAQISGRIKEPTSISKSAFAKKVGISPGRVSQLIKKGLPVEGDGRIDVARGRIWIAENVSPTRSAAQKQMDLPGLPEQQQSSLAAEKIRLSKAQADAAEMKNAILKGEYLAASKVENEWSAILQKVRSGILAIPSRIRQKIPHLTAHEVQIMDTELRRVLTEMADEE